METTTRVLSPPNAVRGVKRWQQALSELVSARPHRHGAVIRTDDLRCSYQDQLNDIWQHQEVGTENKQNRIHEREVLFGNTRLLHIG